MNEKDCGEKFLKRMPVTPFMSLKLTHNFRCQDVIAEMVHTKDGSRLVREFIARGSAKVVKIVKYMFDAHTILSGPKTSRQSHQALR